MNEEQFQELMEKLEKEFGEKLPNPEFFPASFLYYVKMYRYLNDKDSNHS